MHEIPRAAAPHPAFAAALEGGPVPSDPDVLAELTDDERTTLDAFARLSRPSPPATEPQPRKTFQR